VWKRNLKDSSFQLKKVQLPVAARPILQFSFYFKLSCPFFLFFPYKNCYFWHFYLFLPKFLPIEIFEKNLVWTLKNIFLTIKSQNKAKKYLWPPFCMGPAHCDLASIWIKMSEHHISNKIASYQWRGVRRNYLKNKIDRKICYQMCCGHFN
jgi:hypothetical protein